MTGRGFLPVIFLIMIKLFPFLSPFLFAASFSSYKAKHQYPPIFNGFSIKIQSKKFLQNLLKKYHFPVDILTMREYYDYTELVKLLTNFKIIL